MANTVRLPTLGLIVPFVVGGVYNYDGTVAWIMAEVGTDLYNLISMSTGRRFWQVPSAPDDMKRRLQESDFTLYAESAVITIERD
jgi:hypothetical protein